MNLAVIYKDRLEVRMARHEKSLQRLIPSLSDTEIFYQNGSGGDSNDAKGMDLEDVLQIELIGFGLGNGRQ